MLQCRTPGQDGFTAAFMDVIRCHVADGFVIPLAVVPIDESCDLGFELVVPPLASEDGSVQNVTQGLRYDLIGHAIQEASDADEIVVPQGVYRERVDFAGKAVAIRSEDPSDSVVVAATVIDGGVVAVTFMAGEDSNSVLEGLTVSGCNIEGGYPGVGNIDVAPGFVTSGFWALADDPNQPTAVGDMAAVWVAGDYHLCQDSSCLDMGVTETVFDWLITDIDGDARIVGDRPDIGCDEFTPPAAVGRRDDRICNGGGQRRGCCCTLAGRNGLSAG